MAKENKSTKPEERNGFIKRMFLQHKEMILYLIFGVLTTLVSWGSYALFESVFEKAIVDTNVLVAVANVLSWVAAVLFAYITN